MSQNTPENSKTKRILSKRAKIAVISVIVVIVVVIILALSWSSIFPSTSSGGSYQTETILSSGYVTSLNAGYYTYYNFTIPNSVGGTLSGSYTSSADVEVAVLTPTEFGAFTQNPSAISNGQYFSGDNQGTTIDVSLNSGGSYTLVIYNANIFTPDTVTIANSITLGYYT